MKRAFVAFLLALLLLAFFGLSTTAQDTAEPDDEIETFVPSEKLPADAAISFPVDI